MENAFEHMISGSHLDKVGRFIRADLQGQGKSSIGLCV